MVGQALSPANRCQIRARLAPTARTTRWDYLRGRPSARIFRWDRLAGQFPQRCQRCAVVPPRHPGCGHESRSSRLCAIAEIVRGLGERGECSGAGFLLPRQPAVVGGHERNAQVIVLPLTARGRVPREKEQTSDTADLFHVAPRFNIRRLQNYAASWPLARRLDRSYRLERKITSVARRIEIEQRTIVFRFPHRRK